MRYAHAEGLVVTVRGNAVVYRDGLLESGVDVSTRGEFTPLPAR